MSITEVQFDHPPISSPEANKDEIQGKEIEKEPDFLQCIQIFNLAIRKKIESLGILKSEQFEIKPEQVHLMDIGSEPPQVVGCAESDEIYVFTGDFLNTSSYEEAVIRNNLSYVANDFAEDQLAKLGFVLDESITTNLEYREHYNQFIANVSKFQINGSWAEGIMNSEKCLELAATLLHEMLHSLGYRLEKENPAQTHQERLGYFSYIFNYKFSSEMELFDSLNEAMTSVLEAEIFADVVSTLPYNDLQSFAVDVGVPRFSHETVYQADQTILTKIFYNLAVFNHESMPEVQKRFSKGYFTGNLLHLRVIDRVFGKGTLRMYASITSEDLKDPALFDIIFKYFTMQGNRPQLSEVQWQLRAFHNQSISTHTITIG